MSKISKTILGTIMVFALVGAAAAVDLDALDKVTVLMSKANVFLLLGKPDETADLGRNLKVDLYRMSNTSVMVGAACIYENDQRVAGQSFIFQGEIAKEAADRIKLNGFTLLKEDNGTFLLLGNDDDTSQPIVVHIGQNSGMTTVTTFEKSFYDRRIKQAQDRQD